MVLISDFNVRYEMATGDTPKTLTPSYRDLSSSVRIADGIQTHRGRSNEYDTQAQPGTASLSLLNPSGTFTMGNTGSAYAPLQIRRPARITCRYGSTAGNLLSAEDASFEGGTTGTWTAGGSVVPTLSNSAIHPQSGTKGLLITWGTGGSFPNAAVSVAGLTIGRTYTVSGFVWVPTGSPDVQFAIGGVSTGASTAVKNALTQISKTWVATSATHSVQLWPATAPTVGQQCWLDAVMVDEGSTVGTFTTSAPPIYNLWQGFNDSWGNARDELLGIARLRFSDRISRAATVSLMPALKAEFLYDSPRLLFSLGDSAGSTSAGDATGVAGTPTLNSVQLGTGGALDFGVGIAPGPDAGTVAAFTRSSAVNGIYLRTSAAYDMYVAGISGSWLEAMVRPSSAVAQMSAARGYADTDQGLYVDLGVSTTGKARAVVNVDGALTTLTGTTTLPTTSLTHIAVTQSAPSASVVTVRLYVNGTQEATTTYSRAFTVGTNNLVVGGHSAGDLWDGQLAYVSTGVTEMSAARVTQHALGRAGWTGETTDARFNRLCRIAGLPSSQYATTGTGLSTMAAQATSGVALLDALRAVAEAENGVVYTSAAGVLTFAIRSARYAAAVGLTLDATKPGQLGTGFSLDTDDALIVNDLTVSRPLGATQRVVDATSVANYDTHEQAQTLYLDNDAMALAAAQWQVYTSSTPVPRSSTIEIDLVAFANSGGNVAQLLAADIGTRIQVTNLPSDTSSTATADLFIEGIGAAVAKDTIVITLTVSPVGASGSVFIFDDAVYGRWDLGGVYAY